jgi:sulfate/thiosulfate transport system substrate-binding protein
MLHVFVRAAAIAMSVLLLAAPARAADPPDITLLNVSYDPTREFYAALNPLFAAYWKSKSRQNVTINQSHGGSGAQARAVIEGLDADVVTLALAYDVDAIAQRTGAIASDWEHRLPNDSSPYTSTIVFVVRKGNPKQLRDWNDVVAPGINVITANPKTGGGARWNFLAAYAYALKRNHNDDAKARAFVAALYKNVGVLDSGARGSTTTFAERGIGDVLLAWENEAHFILQSHPGAYEIVVPSVSILAQPSVAWVDANVQRHGTTEAAKAYLQFLYTPAAQRLACKFGYRPTLTAVLGSCGTAFPRTDLVTIQSFGGWNAVQARFFADGAIFDQISGK